MSGLLWYRVLESLHLPSWQHLQGHYNCISKLSIRNNHGSDHDGIR